MSLRRFLIPVFCSAVCGGVAGTLAAQDGGRVHEVRMAETRALYSTADWPSGGRRAGLDLGAVELEGFEGTSVYALAGLVTRRYRSLTEGGSAIIVELTVGDTVAEAHEQLTSWLASVSSTGRVPRARELGVAVGDIGFVGRSRFGEDHPEWIAFVRGNVALRATAGDLRAQPRPRLGAVVRSLDGALAAGRLLEPDEPVLRPRITRLVLASSRAVAGDVLSIDVLVADPHGGRAQLAWYLRGSATGYVELDAQGVWKLHTTGPGRLELMLEALGSSGTFARRSVAVVIEDD